MTYQELVSVVTGYLQGDSASADPTVVVMVPTFISLGEADIYRTLRDFRMLQDVNIDYANPPYLIPGDYLETDSVRVGYQDMEFVSKNDILSEEASDSLPTCYSLQGREIIFNGTPDDTAILTYYAKLPALSEATNDIFLLNPDVYLFAALFEAMIFMRDEKRQAVWEGQFTRRLGEVVDASWAAKMPRGQSIRSKVR